MPGKGTHKFLARRILFAWWGRCQRRRMMICELTAFVGNGHNDDYDYNRD
jgi:hypothetical protein